MSAAAAPTQRGGGRSGGGGGGRGEREVGGYMGQNEGVCKKTLGVLQAALGSLERQTEETCTLERGALHAQEGCGPNLISLL